VLQIGAIKLKDQRINTLLVKSPMVSCHITFFFFFGGTRGLEFELRASCLQSRHTTISATPTVHFALVILKMGSYELFALASLEP
jgi:hypothetical protein